MHICLSSSDYPEPNAVWNLGLQEGHQSSLRYGGEQHL